MKGLLYIGTVCLLVSGCCSAERLARRHPHKITDKTNTTKRDSTFTLPAGDTLRITVKGDCPDTIKKGTIANTPKGPTAPVTVISKDGSVEMTWWKDANGNFEVEGHCRERQHTIKDAIQNTEHSHEEVIPCPDCPDCKKSKRAPIEESGWSFLEWTGFIFWMLVLCVIIYLYIIPFIKTLILKRNG